MIKKFEDLEIYQLTYKLAVVVYKLTRKSKNFDLVREASRSARSIASNIAEGFARRFDRKIFNYHLGIALGEANEMLVHLDFLRDFNDLKKEEAEKLKKNYEVLCKKIQVFKQKNVKF